MTDVEWIIGYVPIIAGILVVGEILDKWLETDPRFKTNLARTLTRGTRSTASSWVLAVSDAFVRLFDRLYGARGSRIEELVWSGLTGTLLTILWARSRGELILGTPEALPLFLIASSFMAALFALTRVLITSLMRNRYLVLRSKLMWPGVAIAAASLLLTFLADHFGPTSNGSTVMRAVEVSLIGTSATGIALVTLFVPFERMPVSPFKAIASSLLFVAIIGLILMGWVRPDLWSGFREAVTYKVSHLGFIAFNIYADGFSLLETRLVLRRGADANARALIGLLIVDIMLSATIFLFLPVTLGGVDILREAIALQGDRPWIGVLFWSTFSTSLIFYMYVAAALAVRPLAGLLRLVGIVGTPFSVSEHPVRAISASLAILTTAVFIAGGIWQVIS